MSRKVERVITAHRQLEGGGFVVRRPFPTAGLALVDPFLLLDEMGPADYCPGEAKGAPDHPHRGFEMPAGYIREQGGRIHGFQVWVNLPARDKMMPPDFRSGRFAQIQRS